MIIKLTIYSLSMLSFLWASAPAKPGVIPSQRVIDQTHIMSESYTQGGLVQKMQRIKAANIQLAQSGSRELREDVYMGFPVIMGSYSDSDDLDTTVTMLQQELFDGPWPTITMAEHYEEMSYGQFHLWGTVYGWYEMANSGAFYEGSQVPGEYDNGLFVGDFLEECLLQSDLEIDFAQYDNDGPDGEPNSGDDDGYVDAVAFVHSGPGGEGGGPHVWSHRWRYEAWFGFPFTTNDMGANGSNIRVNDYTIQPAVSAGGNNLIEIGVFSHEFGHALGLPDLYDTDYSSTAVGEWCLMSSGSWSTPMSPTHFSAWCKEMLGWVVPVLPDDNIDSLAFPNAEENAFAAKLWTYGELDYYESRYSHGQDVGREYFLVENRQHIGTEIGIPGTGLVIYHVDNTVTSNRNDEHRMVDIIAADGTFEGGNGWDPWPGRSDNRNFDFQTIPPAIGWAGVNTEVAILNISDSDSTMSADVEIYEATPHLHIIDMSIIETVQDNVFSPGETIYLWPTIENRGATANNIQANLSVAGDVVHIINGSISFNPIGFMESTQSMLPFEFTVNDTLTSQASIFEINLSADDMSEPGLHEMTFMLGWPDVAIIDDDGATNGDEDFQSYYKDALLSAGVVSVVWDIAEDGLPDLAWLQEQPKVIWYTGNNDSPLSDSRINLISTYLDAGGKLILSGQDLGDDQPNIQNLWSDYFAAEQTSDDISSIYVYGDPNHEIMESSDRFTLSSATSADNQTSPDAFSVLEGGSSIFMYPFLSNTSCGISRKTAAYSAVLLGFGMESLSPFDGDAVLIRGEILNRMLVWLDATYTSIGDEELSLPQTMGIYSAYPNPFNPQVSFSVGLVAGERGDIQILDLRGAVVETLDVNASGNYQWQPGGRQPGGVYFIRFLVNGRVIGDLKKITYLK